MPTSTCCRAIIHDLIGHKLEPIKSPIERSRQAEPAFTCCRRVPYDLPGQPQCGLHLLEPVKSPLYPKTSRRVKRIHAANPKKRVQRVEYSFYPARQQVEAGTACRLRTIGDLPGSDNVAAALRLVGQVVLCPAAASACRLSLPARLPTRHAICPSAPRRYSARRGKSARAGSPRA